MSEELLDDDIHEFWELAFNIVTDLEKRLFSFLAAHQLTPPQFYVLKTLYEHQGRCRIGIIAKKHHLTQATVTGLVKRLESLDLVTREQREDDGRSVDVLLTSEGESRFWAVQKSLLEQARTVLSLLPTQEREEALNKVRFYFQLLVEQFPIPAPK